MKLVTHTRSKITVAGSGDERGKRCRFTDFVFRFAPLLGAVLVLSSCATPNLPPPPPRYVYQNYQSDEAMPQLASSNSLWKDTASLYEDVKARRLNDLLTINVVENISGSGTADTKAGRKSSLNAGIDNLFGLPINAMSVNQRYALNSVIKGGMQDDFQGNGATTRAGKLIGTITAKVVEVMPNGLLALESRKELTINNEKQILILRGMVRPDDVAVDNTVLSNRVSDAEVFFVGDGIVNSKQQQGWLVRFLDKIWPF